MKKIILLGLMCLMALSMQAQKCAVLEFRGAQSVTVSDIDGISEMFMTYFRPAGYTMVERAQIDKVISEQGFQRSSITDAQAVRLGKILNVSKVVLGKVSRLGGQYQVDVRVVDVESGHDVALDGATFSGDFRTNVRNLATKLAGKIAISPGTPIQSPKPTPPSNPTQTAEPYVIYGYLKVFPNDLGTFESEPRTIIARLNQSQLYGYGSWRLPTNEEINLMRANNVIGSGEYMTKEKKKKKGIVRLVTDMEKGQITPAVPAGYVDLGLPSGTLWKDKNEDGGFYTYEQAMAKFGNEELPSKEQFEELKSACKWEWTGDGYKVTGPSGNYISLPAAGCRDCGGGVGGVGSSGNYWSSTPDGSDYAWYLRFESGGVYVNGSRRCYGRSVRLVQD